MIAKVEKVQALLQLALQLCDIMRNVERQYVAVELHSWIQQSIVICTETNPATIEINKARSISITPDAASSSPFGLASSHNGRLSTELIPLRTSNELAQIGYRLINESQRWNIPAMQSLLLAAVFPSVLLAVVEVLLALSDVGNMAKWIN